MTGYHKPTPEQEAIIRREMNLSPSAIIHVKPTDDPQKLFVHASTYGYTPPKSNNPSLPFQRKY